MIKSAKKPKNQKKKNEPKSLLSKLGPGLITGASDDDPSGIGTYAQAGAVFGTKMLWTAIYTVPAMIAVQYICAKIALVTGRGLAGVLKHYYPKWIGVLALLFLTIEIFGWKRDLNAKLHEAPSFYVCVIAVTLIGTALTFTGINPMDALVWTAVINGILAPPLLAMIMLVANKSEVMGDKVNSLPLNILGWS